MYKIIIKSDIIINASNAILSDQSFGHDDIIPFRNSKKWLTAITVKVNHVQERG